MSSEEKDNYVALLSTLLVSIPYLIFVLIRYQNEVMTPEEELRYWAIAILLLIPVKIVTHIIMYIILTIITVIVTGNEDIDDITDERDKIIELKSLRNSYYSFTTAFMIALIAIALGKSAITMFVILIVAGILAELVEITSKIILYRRG